MATLIYLQEDELSGGLELWFFQSLLQQQLVVLVRGL
jgi:hypothetical protein